MFGHKQNGTIDIIEFQDVFKYINSWIDFLRDIDLDNSGSIQENELNAVLTKMGYKVSPKFIQFLIQKCDPGNCQSMSVDQFIIFCIQLDKFTGKRIYISPVDKNTNLSDAINYYFSYKIVILSLDYYCLTGAFKARDTDRKGSISIGFEDFLTIALDCSFY